MNFTELPLKGAFRIDLERRADERGFFARVFCVDEFLNTGLATNWIQMNTSLSHKTGTIRGLHFQRPPAAEAKLVRCLAGAMLDVLVDLRQGSATFGHWTAVELTPDNRSMAYVPEGVAHGFQTLKPDTEVLYWHSRRYSQQDEGGVRFDDPAIGINWPLPPSDVSIRDLGLPHLSDLEPIKL